jgi:hypothetical protein
MKEQRDENDLGRLAGERQQALAQRAAAKAGQASAFSGLASMGGSILGTAIPGLE